MLVDLQLLLQSRCGKTRSKPDDLKCHNRRSVGLTHLVFIYFDQSSSTHKFDLSI